MHYVDASSKERLESDLKLFSSAAELGPAISAICSTRGLLLIVMNINNLVVADLVACLPRTLQICLLLCGTDPLLETLVPSGKCWRLGDFVDEVIIERTRTALADPLEMRRHVVTLVAPGGTGKTQIATKFAHENQMRYVNIMFSLTVRS